MSEDVELCDHCGDEAEFFDDAAEVNEDILCTSCLTEVEDEQL